MEENDKESILTRLFDGYNFDQKKNRYIFNLKNNDHFTCKTINSISDASYDSTFKFLFASNGSEERLSDLLNSILFPDEEDKITKLTYLNDECHKINSKHNKGMLKTDLACEIETNKNLNYIVCIEMQITKAIRFTKRLFNYGTALRINNFYKNCFVIGLSLNSEKGTNNTKLRREKDSGLSTLKFIKIIEIDIGNELDNIKNNIPVKINGKEIKNKGKEYLKLLGIRKWGKRDGQKYIIPEFSLITSNNILKTCFTILGSISEEQISLMEIDEQSYMDILNQHKEEGIQEGIQEGILKSAYSLFINGNEEQIESIFGYSNITLNKDEIRNILKDQNEEIVELFIQFLELNKYIDK